jgi:hypothetical protein
MADPAVEHVATINGFDFIGGGNNSSVSTMFVILERWNERRSPELGIDATLGRFFGQTMGLKEALVFAFNPPPIEGLGTTGGFEVYVQNRGEGDTARLAEVVQGFLAELNQDSRLLGVRTLFRADSPQVRVALDREKAKALGVGVDEVFTTLQAAFGSLYVNDFDKGGRVYRVELQAEAPFRSRPEDLGKFHVRSASGAMVPLGSLIRLEYGAGAETLERFNLYPSVKLLGAPAPGRSSAEAIAAVEELAARELPPEFGIAWTGTAYEEKKTGGTSARVLALGMVFVFLILAAQYERWSLPAAVLLAVPFGFLGALVAVWVRGMPNDVYFQIGLVTLVGLASKNAILIVEFASQQREKGLSAVEAAAEAARLRFRPILMTSFAFILGVLPLAVSTGAGAAARRSMGTGVLGGMLAATVLAVAFVPLFYLWLAGPRRGRPRGASRRCDLRRDAARIRGAGAGRRRRAERAVRAPRRLVVAIAALGLAGCATAGPDYARPELALPESFSAAAETAAVPDAWWNLLRRRRPRPPGRRSAGREPGPGRRGGAGRGGAGARRRRPRRALAATRRRSERLDDEALGGHARLARGRRGRVRGLPRRGRPVVRARLLGQAAARRRGRPRRAAGERRGGAQRPAGARRGGRRRLVRARRSRAPAGAGPPHGRDAARVRAARAAAFRRRHHLGARAVAGRGRARRRRSGGAPDRAGVAADREPARCAPRSLRRSGAGRRLADCG